MKLSLSFLSSFFDFHMYIGTYTEPRTLDAMYRVFTVSSPPFTAIFLLNSVFLLEDYFFFLSSSSVFLSSYLKFKFTAFPLTFWHPHKLTLEILLYNISAT